MSPAQLASLVLVIPLVSAAVIALFLRRRGALASYVSVGAAAGTTAGAVDVSHYGGWRAFLADIVLGAMSATFSGRMATA